MGRRSEIQENTELPMVHMAGGQIRWSVTELTQARAQRFVLVQKRVLSALPVSSALLAARMVALDAVPPQALALIEEQGSKPYKVSDSIAIEWLASEPVRIERRLLSSMTVLAWPMGGSADTLGAVTGLAAGLGAWLSMHESYASLEKPVEVLAADQLCWLQAVVPGPLVGHCTGMATLSALPRNAWARLEVGRPLQCDEVQEVSDVGASGTLVQATLDAEGDAYSAGTIRMAEDVFRQRSSVRVDGHIKRAWAQSLLALEGRLRRAHPAVGLVVAWASHMCEAGTLDSANPAALTVKKYALRAMEPLGLQLSKLPQDIEHWSAERLGDLYAGLMEQTNSGSRGEMSAALGSFHAFLQEWFGVPPVARSRGDWTPGKPGVDVNVVWDHEVSRCIHLSSACEDKRLGRMAAACFWIARENPVRIQDLLRLRICNLHPYHDAQGPVLEIEVVRDANRGRLKTEDSQRRLFMRNCEGIAHVLAWLAFRQSEAGPPDALVFGERGNDRKVYRQAALHSYVNTMIKRVSGDAGLRFHHLRHSRISAEVHAILSSVGYTDVNRLEMLAGDAGHASPYTTLRVYSHRYEQALRLWLDLALRHQQHLSGHQAQAWLDEKPNTLIQAARRRGLSLLELMCMRLALRAHSLRVEGVEDGLHWGDVAPPSASVPRLSPASPAVLADALLRLANGQSVQGVATLLNVDTMQVQQLLDRLLPWLQEAARNLHPRKFQKGHAADLASLTKIVGADMDRMFSDRLQPLREHLADEANSKEMAQAIEGWMRCGRGEHIALGHGLPARGLVRLLRTSGVAPAAVRIVHQSPGPNSEAATEVDLNAAIHLFQEEFGCQPIVEARSARVDRPKVYLQISSQPRAPLTPSAASCNAVFKAWLVACQAYLLFTSATHHHDDRP